MTDNPSGGSGEQPGTPQPWFPPAGEPGQPPDSPPGGYQPPGGGYGQPGGYQPPPGYGQAPPGWAPPPGSWAPPPPAPKPGVIPLRPLGVGEILDGAFTSIRRNPRATLGIAAVLLTISGLVTATVTVALLHSVGQISLPAPGSNPTPQQVRHLLGDLAAVLAPTIALAGLLAFIVDVVLTGLLTVVIGRGVLGHKVTAGSALQTALPRLPALLGATLLTLVIVIAPWVVLGLLIVILLAAGLPPGGVLGLGVLGFIAALCLSIWFSVMLRMAAPMVVLERLGPGQAVARSWRLVTRSFWRVFGITLLAGLIVLVTNAVLQLPFSVIAAAAGGGSTVFAGTAGSVAGVIITTIGSIVAGSVARPISAGVAVLLYVDLRMRREGLDLILQSAASGDGPASGDEFASVWRPGSPAPGPAGPPTAW